MIKKAQILILVMVMILSVVSGVAIAASQIETNSPSSDATLDANDHEDNTPAETQNPGDDNSLETTTPSIKVYTNGYKCLEDALKIFDNSKGYKVTSNFVGVTDIMGLGSATQNVKEVVILSGDYYLKETIASCSVSLGQNYYRYFYSNDNGQNVEYRKTSSYKNGAPNWGSTVESATVSKEVMLEKYDCLGYDVFNVRATRKNSTLVKFDRTSDKNNYIVTFVLEPNKVNEKYIQNAKQEGGISSMKINSLKLTYYIDKTTLHIKQVKRNEDYSVDMGISLDVKVTQTYTVNSLDKVLTPSNPYSG